MLPRAKVVVVIYSRVVRWSGRQPVVLLSPVGTWLKQRHPLPPQFSTSLTAPMVPQARVSGVLLTSTQSRGVTMLLSVPLVIALIVVSAIFLSARLRALCFMTWSIVSWVVGRLGPISLWQIPASLRVNFPVVSVRLY